MNGKTYTASDKELSNTHYGKEDNKRSVRKKDNHKEKNNTQTAKLNRNASSDLNCSQITTAEVLGHKRRGKNKVDLSLKKPKTLLGLKYRGQPTSIADQQLNESDKGKSSCSNSEPASSIGYSQDEPLELSFPASVDPIPMHEPTIHETENNSLTLFDGALNDTDSSHFICDVCKEIFEHKYVLSNHSCKNAREKSNDVFKQINRADKIPSKYGEGFETEVQESISIQKRIHTNERFLCDMCGKSFFSRNHLLKHKKGCIVSSKDNQYTCEYCDKSFKYKSSLACHSLIHTGVKPHKCDKCGKSFSRKSHLKIHHEGCGSTDKKYACEECPKKYRDKKDLVIHFRKHTGEKPYECVKCGKSFSDPVYFGKHKKSCGCSPEDRPYACDKCNKKFSRKDNLDRHSLIHSGEKLYGCIKCGKKVWKEFFYQR